VSAQLLPGSVREDLIRRFRANVVGASREGALADHLVAEVAEVGRHHGALRAIATGAAKRALLTRMRRWVLAMPATKRAEWLVDALAEAYGLTWRATGRLDEGPIRVPAKWRARLLRKLDRLADATISKHDDEPEAEEVADLVLEELTRLGSTNERLGRRLVERRFDSGDPRLPMTFANVLERQQPLRASEVLKVIEERLEVEWEE
jgi:hypothetical protein